MRNIHEAKTRLSRLVEETAPERDVLIARVGRPVARPTRLAGTGGKRRPGILDGHLRVPRDFNRPLPEELLRAIEGERLGGPSKTGRTRPLSARRASVASVGILSGFSRDR